MKTSKSKLRTKTKINPKEKSPQPRATQPRFAQPRRKSGAPMAVLHERLNERRIENGRFINFPRMKGRILEKVEFFTAPDFHSLTLYFQDKTSLTLVIEPCFLAAASFADRSSGAQRILKRWPAIRSAAEKS